jgi:CxxC-x17-CxxC domain-containing protein
LEYLSMSVFVDKNLTCRDCGAPFVFTQGEQEFFAEKGFTNEPGRCPDCRAASKARRNSGSGYGTSSDGGYGRRERPMYPAVCSACGKQTEVPFEPRLEKPVYCSDCFTPRQRTSGGSYGDRSGGYRRSY